MRGTGSEVSAPANRIDSIDALRGLVMFTMIFVNDIAGVSNDVVPPWMKHYHGKSGMTFVDLVFPAFLFILGMSIPFALGSRLQKGEPLWKTVAHVLLRTVSLLFIGILMVNETPDSSKMGWSGPLWCTLMYLSAIFAFCTISTTGGEQSRGRIFQKLSLGVRFLGWGCSFFWPFRFGEPMDIELFRCPLFQYTRSGMAFSVYWVGLIWWAR